MDKIEIAQMDLIQYMRRKARRRATQHLMRRIRKTCDDGQIDLQATILGITFDAIIGFQATHNMRRVTSDADKKFMSDVLDEWGDWFKLVKGDA